MNQRQYVADFYRRRPRDGDAPLLSVTVSAFGQIDAHIKAAVKAKKRGVDSSYVIVKEA